MDVNELLDACKTATGSTSDNQLAGKLGVSRQAVSNWRQGRNTPDPVTCAAIAGYTAMPLAKVIGVVGEARAISAEEKKVWRRLAASAAALMLVISSALPARADAAILLANKAEQVAPSMHYAK